MARVRPPPAAPPPAQPAPPPERKAPGASIYIKPPPNVSSTPVRLKGNPDYELWRGFRNIASDQRILLLSGSFEDKCYFGAIDAAGLLAKKKLGEIAFGELARTISTAPLSRSTGVAAVDVVFKIGAYLLNVVGTDSIAKETLEFFVSEGVGYVTSKAAGRITGSVASGPIAVGVNEVSEWLDEDTVAAFDSSTNADARSGGEACNGCPTHQHRLRSRLQPLYPVCLRRHPS